MSGEAKGPVRVLRARLAQGEIDKAEYRRRRNALVAYRVRRQPWRWAAGAAAAVVLLAVVAVTAVALAGRAAGPAPAPGFGYAGGPMGGGGMMGRPYGSGGIGATPADRQVALGNQVPAGAVVDRQHQQVRLTVPSADLVFVASPVQGPDLAFRTAGMTDPTLVVPQGATLTVTLINADREMQHDWLLAGVAPPYPTMGTMMLGPSFPGAESAMLPDATAASMPTQTVTFTADTPGTYYYLCSYPDHAAKHMYGTLIVQPS